MANYGSTSIFGDPRSPGWEDHNLTIVKAPNGQSWRVNKQAADAFNGLFGDLVAAGYDPRSSGGFNYRTIRGSGKLSQHAFGTAIDVNAASNPMLRGRLQTDMPANIGELAARHGLEWGGNWKSRPDPMHFEWMGPAGGAHAPSAVAAQLPMAAPVSALMNPSPIAQQMAPAGVPAPQTLGDVVGQNTVQTTPVGPMRNFGDVAAAMMQSHQERAAAQAEQEAADQQRRAALFGDSLFGPFA